MNISVVIPAYNAGGTLGAAIESCIAQTKSPIEIIVVDDASTDNTQKVARDFSEVTYVQQTSNIGPSAARNRGWDIATGDIVAFLDSDDTWHPQKLATITEIFTDYGHIQYLGHSYTLKNFPNDILQDKRVEHKPYLSILLKNPYQPSCIAARASLPDRFDESYRYCEDHELSIRLAHKYSAHWLTTPLTKLGRPQLSAGGASGNKWKMRKGELRLYSSIYKHNPVFIIFIPFLCLYSLAKMLYRSTKS